LRRKYHERHGQFSKFELRFDKLKRRTEFEIRARGLDLVPHHRRAAAEGGRAQRNAAPLERLEAKFATAGEASADDLDLYQRAAGNLRRLLESIGLQPRAKDIGPTLSDMRRALLAEERAQQP
jgi:hypothetical protein